MNIIIMDTSEQWHNVYDYILTVVGGAEFTSASVVLLFIQGALGMKTQETFALLAYC